MRKHKSIELTSQEIQRAFSDEFWSRKFPPILDVDQAAELAIVEVQTIYTWSSQGRLASCAARAGKHLRIWRDRFVQAIFNQGLLGD